MSTWARAFAETFGAQAVQVAIVFAIVFSLDALVAKRASARLRAALWGVFFVKLVVPPSVTAPWSLARLFETGAESAAKQASASLELPLGELAIAVWAVGFILCFALASKRMRDSRAEWLAGARAAPERLRRRFERAVASGNSARTPRLYVSDTAAGAASVGLWSPVVVVPRALAETEAFEHVLLHELAHVRRRDGLRSVAWSFARCVYWFHPLVHIAARRAALVRELACDEFAARNAPGGVHGYRRTLVDLARSFVETAPSMTAFGGASSMIRVRLEQLEHVSSRSRRELLPALVFTALCVCCIPLGSRVEETVLPSLSDAQGCMQKRFIVLAELARQRTATAHSSDH